MGMLRVEGSNPEDRKIYQREFSQGLNVFEKALAEYKLTQEGPKKVLLKQAMDQALHAMNQVANEELKDLKTKENALSLDYKHYTENPSEDQYTRLQGDIESLKKMVE